MRTNSFYSTAALVFFLPVLCLAPGCTSTARYDGAAVSSLVEERLSKKVYWQDSVVDVSAQEALVNELLKTELNADTALQVALFNNPRLQATFEDIGVAHADLIETGLLQNPAVGLSFRYAEHSASTGSAFSLTQNFIDLFLISAKKKLSAQKLEQAHLQVSKAVLDLALEVRSGFYELQAELLKREALESVSELTEIVSLLAERQHEQGNVDKLEAQASVEAYFADKLEYAKSQITATTLIEKMNRLLGLSTSRATWKASQAIPDPLPLPSADDLSADDLEKIAMSNRLDLQLARLEVEQIKKSATLNEWWKFTEGAAGIDMEREVGGQKSMGPAISGSIPIFNFGQADRLRISHLLSQSLKKVKALEIQIASEVRQSDKEVRTNQELALFFLNERLPL